VHGAVIVQHRDELGNAGRPGLWLLGLLDPVQDGVPVSAVERGEEGGGVLVLALGRLAASGQLRSAFPAEAQRDVESLGIADGGVGAALILSLPGSVPPT
jgi:hypothetical protein